MALKKPSDYFKKDIATVNNSVQELVKTPELNTFSDAFESFKNNLSKIEVLSEFSDTLDNYRVNIERVNHLSKNVEDIQTEIQTLLKKEDLDRAMMSQLLVVEQSIRDLQSKVKGINEKNLTEIRLDVSGLTQSVNEFLEIEVPQYKRLIVDSELRTDNRFTQLEENVNQTLEGIGEFVGNKYQELTETLQGINEQSLAGILEDFKLLGNIVQEFKEQDIPKYKGFIVETERKTENKLNEFQEKLDETVSGILEKVSSIDVDNTDLVEIINQKIEDVNKLSRQVRLTEQSTEDYKNQIKKKVSDLEVDILRNETHIRVQNKNLKAIQEEVKETLGKINLQEFEDKSHKLGKKIKYLEEVFEKFSEKEILTENIIVEPPSTDNKDPLTPLDQNFVTLDQLQQHYRLFINRIQQQLATIGGGGETRLEFLDDVDRDTAKTNGYVLQYDSSVGKFIGTSFIDNADNVAIAVTNIAPLNPLEGNLWYDLDIGRTFIYYTDEDGSQWVDANPAGSIDIAEENIVYVAKDGSDSNNGTLTSPKLTIKAAVESISSSGATDKVVRVAPGTYIEDNPIILPDEVTVIGQSLRETTVIPQNDDQDLFYVGNGNYIAEMSFRGSLPNKAIVAFDPEKPRYIVQSPYIQNCTNFIPDSIGLKVDGNAVIGPIKSMVLDSYTQYNQGGIGASITNQGYAQLVSLFTICDDIAIYCGNGGACDLTNSNSSFGNYGLVADGVSPKKYSGIITSPSASLSETFVVDLSTPELSVSNAVYDNVSGIVTITTSSPHRFNIGMGVSITGLGFTCSSGPGILTYPSGNKGYVFNARTVAPGRYFDSYNLIQANRQEIIDNSYAAINVAYPSFVNPDPDKCKRDIGYIVDAISIDVRDFTSKNTIEATKSYFKYDGSELITNGILGEVPQTIVGFTSARDLIKLAITNNLTVKDLTIASDPETGSNTDPSSCSDVRSFVDNLVGIITTRLDAGNLIGVNALPLVSMASTTFSAYVGVSTLQHTYVSGGTVKTEVVRPYDGQVIYFNDLYNTVKTIAITDGGSGYTSPPIVTVDAPSASWGVRAKAIATVENGSVTQVDLLSNGRGYTTTPSITFSAPQTGINTAIGEAVLTPEYYTINKSTEISNGISTITLNENVPFAVGVGTEVNFFKQSRILATGHSFEFIGSGTDIANSIPFNGGSPPIPENETDSRNGGLVVYTSTNQSGNFKIGDGVTINQNTSSITGQAYEKSLVSTMTPYILSLGAL